MFWRNKKITFRDFATTIILRDSVDTLLLYIDISGAKVMAVESMKFGIAVGAQFPTKVMPMLKQASGDDAANAYSHMKEFLQS